MQNTLFTTNWRNNKRSIMTCSDSGNTLYVVAYRQSLNGECENFVNVFVTADELEQLKACKNFTEARKMLVSFKTAYESRLQNTIDEIERFPSRVQSLLDVCSEMDDILNTLLGDNAIADMQAQNADNATITANADNVDMAQLTANATIFTINAKPKSKALIAHSGILAPRCGHLIRTMPIRGQGCEATLFRKKYKKTTIGRAPPCGASA